LPTGAVVQLVTTLVAFIHELAEFQHLLFFSEILGLTGGFEVGDALTFRKDVHGSLVKEELGVLSFHFVDVGYIVHQLETIIAVRLLVDPRRSVATWAQMLTHDLQHALLRLLHRFLQLLERFDWSLQEVGAQTTPLGQQSHSKATLNDPLVITSANGEDLG